MAPEPLISPELASRVLSRALKRGGEFAEVFAESRRSFSMRLDERKIEDVISGTDRGASIRVVNGATTLFGYVDSLDEASLLRLADELSQGLEGPASGPLSLTPDDRRAAGLVRIALSEVQATGKADVLRLLDETCRARSAEVRQVTSGYSENEQEIAVANSFGTYSTELRTRVSLSLMVVAQRGEVIQTSRETLAHAGGYELIASADLSSFAVETTDKAVTMLGAQPSPAGRMPVVLASGFGGVLFHEACGHGLEADFILKKTSVWEGRLGEKVAGEFVTAYDDGSTTGYWGSTVFDDEGTPSQKTAVIRDGVLASFLTDLLRGRKLGLESTGNGRRESFRHLPYPRMTNTYFGAGQGSPADLIASTPRAFYAKSLAGGQVEPATGDFVFGVSEGYLIEGGKVTTPVRGATLIGNGLEVLRNIDAIADDLDMKAGMCGKEGQYVPVGTGQPMVRLRELTVGGTAA